MEDPLPPAPDTPFPLTLDEPSAEPVPLPAAALPAVLPVPLFAESAICASVDDVSDDAAPEPAVFTEPAVFAEPLPDTVLLPVSFVTVAADPSSSAVGVPPRGFETVAG